MELYQRLIFLVYLTYETVCNLSQLCQRNPLEKNVYYNFHGADMADILSRITKVILIVCVIFTINYVKSL